MTFSHNRIRLGLFLDEPLLHIGENPRSWPAGSGSSATNVGGASHHLPDINADCGVKLEGSPGSQAKRTGNIHAACIAMTI